MDNKFSDIFIDKSDSFKLRQLSTEQREQVLHHVINSVLTARQRDCLVLRFFEGMSVTQIALHYGVNPSTVSRHIKKAKIKIAKSLPYYLLDV